MIAFLDMLNVKPAERRPVIVFLMGVLVVGNLVWLSIGPGLLVLKDDLAQHESDLKKLKDVPAMHEQLKLKVAELNPKAGVAESSEQAALMMDALESAGRRLNINFTSNSGGSKPSKRDYPFNEYKRTLSFETDYRKLVMLLLNLAEMEGSMIRVSDFVISRSGDSQRLKVKLSFVASYPKPNFDPNRGKKKKRK